MHCEGVYIVRVCTEGGVPCEDVYCVRVCTVSSRVCTVRVHGIMRGCNVKKLVCSEGV